MQNFFLMDKIEEIITTISMFKQFYENGDYPTREKSYSMPKKNKSTAIVPYNPNSSIQTIMTALNNPANTSELVTKDEYIIYCMSELDIKIKEIIKLSELHYLEKDFLAIGYYYNDWIVDFSSRTGKIFVSKSGIFAAGIATVMGIGLISGTLFIGGIVSVAVSGCYLLWNRNMTNMDSENKKYNKLVQKLDELLIHIKIDQSSPFQQLIPTAPSKEVLSIMPSESPEYMAIYPELCKN